MNRLLLLIPALLLATTAVAKNEIDVTGLRAELRDAWKENDGESMSKAANTLLQEFSGHPTYLFYAARGAALQGKPRDALDYLENTVARGVHFPDLVASDAAFEALRALPEFPALKRSAAALDAPARTTRVTWSFGPPDTQPESVAIRNGKVWLASVRHGAIFLRKPDATIEQWNAPGNWSVLGMHFSPDGRMLLAATAAMNASEKSDAADRGRTALVAFDPESGKVIERFTLDRKGEHVFGDFIFLDDTTVLATDSVDGSVWSLDLADGKFSERVPGGTLRSPQGLARLGRWIIIADYSNGLYRFDANDNSLRRVHDGDVAAPYGVDGLYAHKGELIAIQNGVRPWQVNRFRLSENADHILERERLATHTGYGEPTLGTIEDGIFYFVGNSLWNHVDEEGGLAEKNHQVPVILSLEP